MQWCDVGTGVHCVSGYRVARCEWSTGLPCGEVGTGLQCCEGYRVARCEWVQGALLWVGKQSCMLWVGTGLQCLEWGYRVANL